MIDAPARRDSPRTAEAVAEGAPFLVVQDADREAIADALAELLVADLEQA